MATVNHKKIREAIDDKKCKITDKDFFTLRKYGYPRYLEDIASAQTKRYLYDRRPKVEIIFDTENEMIAQTNNLTIKINTASPCVSREMTRTKKHWRILGLFVHELGHMLFTDFLTIQSWSSYRRDGRWFPDRPPLHTLTDIENEKLIADFAGKGKRHIRYLSYIVHYLWNILEDGYIENRLAVQFPGMFGAALKDLRKEMYESSESMGSLLDKGNDQTALVQGLLQYATTGKIKYGSISMANPIVFLLHDLLSEIDEAVCRDNPIYRAKAVNRILVHLWTYFEQEIDENEPETPEEGEESDSEEEMEIPDFLKGIVGSSQIGSGGRPIRDTVENRKKIEKLLSKLLTGNNNASSFSSEENDSDEEDDGLSSTSQTLGHAAGNVGKAKRIDAAEEETGRLENNCSGEAKAQKGGSITYDQSYTDWFYDKAATDIERVLEKGATASVQTDLESERLCKLQSFASTIPYGDIHKGVNIVIRRNVQVDDRLIDQYDQIKKPLLEISDVLSKKLVKSMEEKQKKTKMTGLSFGRNIEGHSLYRKDGKIFSKRMLPSKSKICVAYVIDGSTSMSSNDRITYARAAAIVIDDFCTRLNIPVMITGHHTDVIDRKRVVVIESYSEFDQIDNKDRYRLMGIAAAGSNRDGCAIRYVCERLLSRNEEIKIFIIASDGQPNDGGYFGEAAVNDLRAIKKEYQRKGIIFVAAAIGDDREKIQSIYGDSFCDISDLKKLPVILTNFIKRHLHV